MTTAQSAELEPTTPPPGEPDERLASRGLLDRLVVRPEIGALLGALLVFVFFSRRRPSSSSALAASPPGWTTPRRSGIMAVAVALLMIGGEFDLSAGVMTGVRPRSSRRSSPPRSG